MVATHTPSTGQRKTLAPTTSSCVGSPYSAGQLTGSLGHHQSSLDGGYRLEVEQNRLRAENNRLEAEVDGLRLEVERLQMENTRLKLEDKRHLQGKVTHRTPGVLGPGGQSQHGEEVASAIPHPVSDATWAGPDLISGTSKGGAPEQPLWSVYRQDFDSSQSSKHRPCVGNSTTPVQKCGGIYSARPDNISSHTWPLNGALDATTQDFPWPWTNSTMPHSLWNAYAANSQPTSEPASDMLKSTNAHSYVGGSLQTVGHGPVPSQVWSPDTAPQPAMPPMSFVAPTPTQTTGWSGAVPSSAINAPTAFGEASFKLDNKQEDPFNAVLKDPFAAFTCQDDFLP